MRLLTLVCTLATAFLQSPEQLAVLASGAVEGSLVALRNDVPPSTYTFDTSQGLARRLAAGAAPDVLVAAAPAIDQLIANGSALADSRATIGRMPIGVAVSRSARRPDLSSVDTLKAAIRNASAIVISQGASGAHLEKVFADLGIAGEIADKIVRQPRGDEVMKRLGEERGSAIGFTMASEIRFGVRHGANEAGLLPAALQSYTQYDAVVMTVTRHPASARAFVRAITGPSARSVLAANGWE